MRNFLKKILKKSPIFIRKFSVQVNELFAKYYCNAKENKNYKNINNKIIRKTNKKIKNILIYHIAGLGFGGTEKNLQNLANNLTDDYTIFFMCSSRFINEERKELMNKKIKIILFDYKKKEDYYPYFIYGMKPHIKNILEENSIDLLIISDTGHSQYPFNTIKNIPIIFINNFGAPCLQKNVVNTIFVSETVQKHSEFYTGKKSGNISLFVPLSKPPKEATTEAKKIRTLFNIHDDDFVFGRIGRNSDDIFDAIGIESFEKVIMEYPKTHYIIMSPPPILQKIVKERKIKNVHFINPSGDETKIWGFHYAIDSLAHFRSDGETFGLNIAESMYARKPIISHTSEIWNAHIDYLRPEFARIAELHDTKMYINHMKEYINLKELSPEKWQEMGEKAHIYATEHFSEELYIKKIKNVILTSTL